VATAKVKLEVIKKKQSHFNFDACRNSSIQKELQNEVRQKIENTHWANTTSITEKYQKYRRQYQKCN